MDGLSMNLKRELSIEGLWSYVDRWMGIDLLGFMRNENGPKNTEIDRDLLECIAMASTAL